MDMRAIKIMYIWNDGRNPMRPNQMSIGNENPIESKNIIIMHYWGCNILIFQAWERQQNQIQEIKLLINTRPKYSK
jgi:hypothetical protein